MVTLSNASSNCEMLRRSAPRKRYTLWSWSPTIVICSCSAASVQGDLVLRHVGVLVLVDQHVLEPLLIVRQHIGVVAEQLDRLHQQIVEVHRPGLQQAGLVVDVDVGVLAFEDVGGPLDGLLRADQLVLPQADLAVRGARREPLGVEVEVANDVAGQTLRIGLVVDAERAWIAEPIAVGPQDANARGVKRAHPHRPGDRARRDRRHGGASLRPPCW